MDSLCTFLHFLVVETEVHGWKALPRVTWPRRDRSEVLRPSVALQQSAGQLWSGVSNSDAPGARQVTQELGKAKAHPFEGQSLLRPPWPCGNLVP